MLPYPHLVCVAATTLVLAACSSKQDDAKPTTPVGMSWTVDGMAVSTTTTQSQKSSGTVSIAGTAAGSTAGYVSLEIPNAVGIYTFSPTSTASALYSTPAPSTTTVYYAGASTSSGGVTVMGGGTIVVTSLTATNVTGTFTFTGVNQSGASKAITDGTFNVGL
jgi:hypothetical protein